MTRNVNLSFKCTLFARAGPYSDFTRLVRDRGVRDMQNTANSAEDLISSLGTIYGVSEIKKSTSEDLSCCPVLVAENALFFFAWDENEPAGAGN